jgi:uncharacterized peroxidase-related enzyme
MLETNCQEAWMTQVPLLTADQLTDPVAARVYGEIERELGFGIVPNVFRAMATNPTVLEANWNLFRSVVLQGQLPRLLKEMIGVVVSAVHSSDYARLVHLHSLSVQGVSENVLRSLSEGTLDADGLSPATVATLRFAQRVATSPREAGSAGVIDLEGTGLSPAEVLEVLAAVQVFTAVNIFTDTVQVPIDGA